MVRPGVGLMVDLVVDSFAGVDVCAIARYSLSVGDDDGNGRRRRSSARTGSVLVVVLVVVVVILSPALKPRFEYRNCADPVYRPPACIVPVLFPTAHHPLYPWSSPYLRIFSMHERT